jgi:hypothetical protein
MFYASALKSGAKDLNKKILEQQEIKATLENDIAEQVNERDAEDHGWGRPGGKGPKYDAAVAQIANLTAQKEHVTDLLGALQRALAQTKKDIEEQKKDPTYVRRQNELDEIDRNISELKEKQRMDLEKISPGQIGSTDFQDLETTYRIRVPRNDYFSRIQSMTEMSGKRARNKITVG